MSTRLVAGGKTAERMSHCEEGERHHEERKAYDPIEVVYRNPHRLLKAAKNETRNRRTQNITQILVQKEVQ